MTETLDTTALLGRALSLHDFDGTTHETFESVDGGYSVEQACAYAVEKVLGSEALSMYEDGGGLRNRAPSGIIDSLAPNLVLEERRALTEKFVDAKLEPLSAQIGRRLPGGGFWPRPTAGFAEYWGIITNESGISTGFVSSGHQSFIERVLDVQGLEQPDVFVTDDDMRKVTDVIPRVLCEKPSPLPVDIAIHRWLSKLKIVNMEAATDELGVLRGAKQRVVVIGDSLEKDGGMARNAGVQFVHAVPGGTEQAFNRMGVLLMTRVRDFNAQ